MFETHQEQAAFTLALDVKDISRACRRKDYAPLGISRRDRHGGIVPPNTRERKRVWRLYGLDLPDEVLRKIYYKNALRILPGIDTSLFPAG